MLWVLFTHIDCTGEDRGCGGYASNHNECSLMVGYVDDGGYSVAGSDLKVLSQKLGEKYRLLEQWMHANRLKITAEKT